MKILIAGTWDEKMAISAEKEANEIGEILAKNGHTLVSGAGTGISGLAVKSYKENKGKRYIAYLTSKGERLRIGEEIGIDPDEIVHTGLDYPMRNALMLQNCDAVIALHGRLGTLAEIIHIVNDYKKKVVVMDKGNLAKWVKAVPELKEQVFITKDVKEAIKYLEK